MRLACLAVAGSLRPRVLRAVAGCREWSTGDTVADAAFVLQRRILDNEDDERLVPWWSASGDALSWSLRELRGCDEPTASHLVGAAVAAHIAAGLDLASHSVLAAAECGYAWMLGADRRGP